MPARRRAPPGCGPQAPWLRCSLLTYRSGAAGMLVARALPAGLGASSKMYTLFPDGPKLRNPPQEQDNDSRNPVNPVILPVLFFFDRI